MEIKIGLQLFSIKEAMKEDSLGAIEKAAACGYRYLEAANHNALEDSGIGFGVSPADLTRVLQATGTRIVSTHIYPFDKEKFKAILDYNAAIGNPNIIYPMDRFHDRDDVLRRCELLNEYGEMANAYHIRFSYHNHANEFMTVDRQLIMDLLMDNTDPDKVGFELDTFWAMRGGIDPIEYMRRFRSRITLLHQKDMSKTSPSPVNVFRDLEREVGPDRMAAFRYCKQRTDSADFTEIGTGIMDIQSIIDAANELGTVSYMFLEQDSTQLPSELLSIQRSMEAFRKFHGISWE